MNTKLLKRLALVLAAGMLLAACAGQASAPALAGSTWKLISYGPVGNQAAAAAGIATALDFGKDDKVSGNMGCNSFGGNYQVKNGSIIFSQMISTMMACSGPGMDQETAALQVLNGTAQVKLQGNTLVITAEDGKSAITLGK